MSLYLQISVFPTIHKGTASLYQIETILENHNQPKCKVAEPSSNRHIQNTTFALRLSDHCGTGGRKSVRSQGIRSLPINCLLEISEATPMKSHQHGCRNMT